MAVKTVQAIINGQTVNLQYNSETQKYEATITAPAKSSFNINSGHYYPVTVKATDAAGNVTTVTDQHATLGGSLKLKVKEKTPPTITIQAPTSGQLMTNSKPVIQFKVMDDDSGVNAGSIKITIDSNEAITEGITKNKVTGGYECSYTPAAALTDGSHTIKIDAADNDGNKAAQKSVTFKVDTTPPALSVTAPGDNAIVKTAALTVTGTTSDKTSAPVRVTVKVNSGTAENVEVGSGGGFSREITLVEGRNTITVVATDAAGKSTTVTRTVTLDTKAPVISAITITPNPVDAGKTYVISVEVTD